MTAELHAKRAIRPVPVAGVLVGGSSVRMGTDKAGLSLPEGTTMVERVVRIVAESAIEVVLLGRAAQLPPALSDLIVLSDEPGRPGPAAGLASLLRHAEDRWSLLVSCDLPKLTPQAVLQLADRVEPDADAVVYRTADRSGRYEACCALYHPRILPVVLDELRTGGASLQSVLRNIRTVAVCPDEDTRRALVDVDTPEDWRAFVDDSI